jgi:hypothetical protein
MRIGLTFDDAGPKINMIAMLQMMQDIHNCMMYFEHRFIIDPKPTVVPTFYLLTRPNLAQPEGSSINQWCNFYGVMIP